MTDHVDTAARLRLPCQGEEAAFSDHSISFSQSCSSLTTRDKPCHLLGVVTAMVTYFLECCQATLDLRAFLSNIEQTYSAGSATIPFPPIDSAGSKKSGTT